VSGFSDTSSSLASFLGFEVLGFPAAFFFSSDEVPEAFESLAERRPGVLCLGFLFEGALPSVSVASSIADGLFAVSVASSIADGIC
jgi:hypothetical protein